VATERSLTSDRELVLQTLRDIITLYAMPKVPFRALPVFDMTTDNYLLMDEGWDGYKRIHRVWLHIELRDGKFWIHEDGTEEGVANRLLAAGIPKERIVLSFHAPNLRTEEGFALN
jgi:hypothetical protein